MFLFRFLFLFLVFDVCRIGCVVDSRFAEKNWTNGRQCLADDYFLQHSTGAKTDSHKKKNTRA